MFISTLFASAGLASLGAASILQHGNSHAHDQSQMQEDNTTVSKQASYILRDSYMIDNFFSEFNFFTDPDPTHGFVRYVSQDEAWAKGLINTNERMVRLGVDYTTMNPEGGRASVRVTSKKSYNHGLFIADIHHMPGSICGIWPAYWMFGPGWPKSGEIDIIEGVHHQPTNAITMHTTPGCYANLANSQEGTYIQDSNCNAGTAFQGCSAHTRAPFGDKFNAGYGGVYATQWESSGIYVWFWPRGSIPADIKALRPDTTLWGTPLVSFNGGGNCNIDQYFKDQNIVFNTAFCGDWAGSTWGSSECSSKAPTCQDYVSNNPAAFKVGYWKINSVRVYQF